MQVTANKSSNPVLQSEFRYQRFVIQNSRSGWIWILLAVLLVVPALIGALVYIFGLSFGLIVAPSWVDIPYSWHFGLSVNLFVMAVSLSIVVMLVTYSLAYGSIRREKEKHTWALLRLSNVDNGKIVLGKWWASLWALNGDNVMVIVLRIGTLAMACALFLPAWQQVHNEPLAPYRLYFFLLAPFVFLQALLDAGLSAAMGIASAIPDDAWASVVSSASMVLRLLITIGIGYWYYLIASEISSNFIGLWLLSAQITLASLIVLMLVLISAKLILDYV